MLPRTFLTQLIPARIDEAARRLQSRIWTPLPDAVIEVAGTESFRDPDFRTPGQLTGADFTPVSPNVDIHWGPKYSQRWFRLVLPDAPAGDKSTRYLEWRDQAEATLYIDGIPYSGLDLAHRYCPLPDGTREALVESVCIRSGIWLDGTASHLEEQGSRYTPPRLFTRNDAAWNAYHDLKVLLDLLEVEHRDYQPPSPVGPPPKVFTDPVRNTPPVFRASPLFRRLSHRLDVAVHVFDRKGLNAFAQELRKIYRDFPADLDALHAVLTGHAHIDLVWLWPERVGEFKAVHSWATQVRLLTEYPEFRFGYSQPASYRAVERIAPALHEQVRGLIAQNRWEATGASYVESDTQIPCGEALWRSLRMGQDEFSRLRGTPASVFWLPDVFGYSGCVPQLLRACGVTGFFTTKLSWSSINRPPHTSFMWRGNDGTEVASHLVLLHDYNEAANLRRLREDALHHQQAAVHGEFLVPTGYGDGGGGPTEEMCERVRRLNNLAGAPRAQWGGIEEFYEKLNSISQSLPVCAGELMLEIHRGVYTTHGRLKTAFRSLERALQIQEAAHVAAGMGPVDLHAWERLVFAQFHDYIPGSSIWEVYEKGIPEIERLAVEALTAAKHALMKNCGTENQTDKCWFNPLPQPRNWIDGDACYRMQPLSGGSVMALECVNASNPCASSTELASDRVRATFDATGGLLSLAIDGEAVALRGTGHRLLAYPDHPASFEAWDIDRNTLVDGLPAQPVGEPDVIKNGLSSGVRFTYRVAETSTARVFYHVRAAEPVLRIDYEIDWRDAEFLLKAVFETGYDGRMARFGAPFGSTLRGQWPGYPREEALWEVPFSRWLTVTDDAQAKGLSVITRDRYGASVRDGAVGVTLVRSAFVTEADHHPQIRETPNRPVHSDIGVQSVSLAIGRYHHAQPANDQAPALADSLFTPCVRFDADAPCAVECGLVGIQNTNTLQPCWAEPGRDGIWALRVHETGGESGEARLEIAKDWCASACALGTPLEAITDESWHAGSLEVPYRAYEVKTVWFKPVGGRSIPQRRSHQ
ncbi:alpha-mannosidase [Ereboglobus luteus]|uniref:Alpha-mannosidase n=1 Tax=Ereboglobus luteus TaxID=1796921 RepID=A0A2U8E609_9BACT|nr:alpha-mannosidase [Ereboglobus luteus]AWI09962.1 alpha-mannosidase [Ereboglobus luteus]